MTSKQVAELEALELPQSNIARRVFDLVQEVSPEYLFNHCVRTYFFAEALGRRERRQYDSEVLFFSCMMHDLGLTAKFRSKTRFEVDGADAASRFLLQNGVDQATAEIVWDAIALHATFHIPQRKREEIALLQLGTGVDVTGRRIEKIAPETIKRILEEYPRLNLKQNVINDFVNYLKQNPAGGMGYWLSEIAEKYVEGAPHFSVEAVMQAAPFSE